MAVRLGRCLSSGGQGAKLQSSARGIEGGGGYNWGGFVGVALGCESEVGCNSVARC